jgi:nucleoside-diphosphate-sugar epimerase
MDLQIRILVAGGGGFLGSHLCERLVADGARRNSKYFHRAWGNHRLNLE